LLPGILVFRVESALLYFNVDHVRQIVWEHVLATPELGLVVCDLSDSPSLDVAAGRMLAGLHRDLAKRKVRLRLVEAHAKGRDLLRAEGLEEQVGYLGRHSSVDQAIEDAQDAIKTSINCH
jgi:SulP family sulfate permease